MTRAEIDFQVLTVDTPEGVRFRIPLAGPAVRFLAWFLDALVIATAFASATRVLHTFEVLNQDMTYAVLTLFYFLLNLGYAMTLEWMWHGQTIGKKLFGLRVIDAGGKRLEFTQILLRNILRFVDSLPLFYLIGGAALVLSKRRQRLGDMAANTVVIRQKKLTLPEGGQAIGADRFNSLLEHPHLAARLRQSVPAQLAYVAIEAVVRRDELSPDARVAVFHALAKEFEQLVKFPEDTIAGFADERYVRNCLQIVLSSGNFRSNRLGA